MACGFAIDSSPRTNVHQCRGKKQISAAMAIFGSMPLPSSSTRIGALATTGMVLTTTTTGKKGFFHRLAVHEHGGDQDRRQVAKQEAGEGLDRRR